MLGVFDEQLIEEDYDDIEEEKFSRNASKGWFGIGDKYWITSVIPPRNKSFKTTFDYKINLEQIIYPLKELKLVLMMLLKKKFKLLLQLKELRLLMVMRKIKNR